MQRPPSAGIRGAAAVLPCGHVLETAAFLCEHLGFVVESVWPADDPQHVTLSGHGARVLLDGTVGGPPGHIRVVCDEPEAVWRGGSTFHAPDGTAIELVAADPPVVLPPLKPSIVVSRAADGTWKTGRAGMRYRDLIPGRQGGRIVASHIHVPDGGPVPDYVHFHRVRFQMIYCRSGDVRVVYEDQGPPFVIRAGDAVLQPPRIRHRVLESSAGLEVIEAACPAAHETVADQHMTLPGPRPDPDPGRTFEGQRFVRHQASSAVWGTACAPGFACRDLGIHAATGGFAHARVLRRAAASRPTEAIEHEDLLFRFVLTGTLALRAEGYPPQSLGPGDTITLPPGLRHHLEDPSEDLELLELTLAVDDDHARS